MIQDCKIIFFLMNNVQNEDLGGEVGRKIVNVCWTEVLREALECYDSTACHSGALHWALLKYWHQMQL